MARNRYGGKCYRCGEWVAPGEGHFERVKGKGWRTQHADCAIKAREERRSALTATQEADDGKE